MAEIRPLTAEIAAPTTTGTATTVSDGVNVRIIKMGMKENSDLLRTYLVNKLIVLHQEKLKFEERHGEV